MVLSRTEYAIFYIRTLRSFRWFTAKPCHPCVLRFRHAKRGNWSCFLEKTIMTLHSISVNRGAASNYSFVLDKLLNPVKI